LETITKIEQILNISLIEVPEFQTTIQVKIEQYKSYSKSDELVGIGSSLSDYKELFGTSFYEDKPNDSLKLVA
jgi:hypothetical protein